MEFVIEKAEARHAGEICALLAAVDGGIQSRELFIADTPEAIGKHIEEEGFCLLAKEGEALAALLMVDTLPARSLAWDLKWSEEKVATAAVMDTVVVSPTYRGHRLQQQLIGRAEEMLREDGYRAFLATVSPKNAPSLNNFLALGYEIAVTKEKYGGVLRHILVKGNP